MVRATKPNFNEEPIPCAHPRGFSASALRSGGTGAVAITWTSVPGKPYVIEYNSDLGGVWQTLTTEIGDASPAATTSMGDLVPADVARRFYRVRVGP